MNEEKLQKLTVDDIQDLLEEEEERRQAKKEKDMHYGDYSDQE